MCSFHLDHSIPKVTVNRLPISFDFLEEFHIFVFVPLKVVKESLKVIQVNISSGEFFQVLPREEDEAFGGGVDLL